VVKPLNSAKQTVDLGRPSIRRAPPAEPRQIVRRSSEEELVLGVTGVMLTAIALGVIVIGIGILTAFRAATAPVEPFRQCYSAGGADCVIDGDTIWVSGQRVDIAGIVAPQVRGGACERERERGIAAAIGLSEILRGGEVVVGPVIAGADGAEARVVTVDGQDVGKRMIRRSLARPPWSDKGWC